MLGLLDKTSTAKPEDSVSEPNLADASEATTPREPEAEFELVVGRRQVASWLFLIVLLVGAASTAAFIAGKMTATATAKPAPEAPKAAAPQPAKPAPAETSVQTPSAEPVNPAAPAVETPLPQATIVNAPFSAFNRSPSEQEPPIFQDPKPGSVYLQMGALDRGMAAILVQGLRKHGFEASVAPGPTEKIFRVLIGPLPDPESYSRAKAEVDAIGLGTFTRKYQQ
jgi:cell division septation protein DedD